MFVHGSGSFVEQKLVENGIGAVALKPGMSGLKVGRIAKKFETGECQVLVLKYSVHSTGLDFAHVRHVVLLTPAVKEDQTKQAIGRIKRMSQKHREFFVHKVLYEGLETERAPAPAPEPEEEVVSVSSQESDLSEIVRMIEESERPDSSLTFYRAMYTTGMRGPMEDSIRHVFERFGSWR